MRKFNYGSVILLMILSGIIAGVFENIYDGNLAVIGTIFAWIINYIICRGLLYNREGSFSEYFRGIKTITGKVFLMNILIGLINSVALLFSALTSGTGAVLTDAGMRGILLASLLFILVTVFLSLIFAYSNFVMADERYRDLPFFTCLKLITKAGFKLFSETFVMGLKVFKVTIISLLLALAMIIPAKSMPEILTVSFIALIVAAIAAVIVGPNYIARLSDIYLDNIEGIYGEIGEDIETL
ncbi:MAG: hypothetical protein E6249_02775 [Peptoniphilus grossensis]|uniref:hypothetical protein n=1 Tax=Peptoniphilus grossensis TaxID=1465756 RepID=UPI002587FBF3|nr:hypothetical protein [Peptoniphilus grossensis]MDU5099373.1 hypothetical protein [Peptoniphilus grossensis]MDU7150720.1 hypothetical protein [Peptoniphilus grossensis]